MNPKALLPVFITFMLASFFELLSLWMQFDKASFGRGGWGYDLIRDSLNVSPAEIVVRLRAGFELAVLACIAGVVAMKLPEEE